jgi:hypothetical protein
MQASVQVVCSWLSNWWLEWKNQERLDWTYSLELAGNINVDNIRDWRII